MSNYDYMKILSNIFLRFYYKIVATVESRPISEGLIRNLMEGGRANLEATVSYHTLKIHVTGPVPKN